MAKYRADTKPMPYLTKAFWMGAGERAIKTFAQILGTYFVVGQTSLIGFDWIVALSLAGGGAVASLITSIANPDFTAGETPKEI